MARTGEMILGSLTNIAILASGNGSNAETIVKYCKFNSQFNVKIIISNNENAFVLKRQEVGYSLASAQGR